LIREAAKIVGPFKGLKMLDASTHLTLRDWVNSPGGSAYGVLRSTKQMTSAAMLNRTSVEGLFLAGQSVLAPGIFGTVLGSFYTVKQMMGHKKFLEEVVL
jgi:phytoene dehydrogenase-like protein